MSRMVLRRYLEILIMRDENWTKVALLHVAIKPNWFNGRGMPRKTIDFLSSLAENRDWLTPRQLDCARNTLLRYIWFLMESIGEEKIRVTMEKAGVPDENGRYPREVQK